MSKMPYLKDSEEAIAFGKVATPDQIELLKSARSYYLNKIPKICKSMSMEAMDNAMIYATQSQFMREALQSAGVKV